MNNKSMHNDSMEEILGKLPLTESDPDKSKEAIREIIATRIRSSRLAEKMTQEEMSSKSQANRLTYRGYENCRSDIPIIYLIRIADVLNLSLDYLTGRTNQKEPFNQTSPDLAARVAQLEKAVEAMQASSKADTTP